MAWIKKFQKYDPPKKKFFGTPQNKKNWFSQKRAHPIIYLRPRTCYINGIRTSCTGICLGHQLSKFSLQGGVSIHWQSSHWSLLGTSARLLNYHTLVETEIFWWLPSGWSLFIFTRTTISISARYNIYISSVISTWFNFVSFSYQCVSIRQIEKLFLESIIPIELLYLK